jgi:hypothetical protein
MDIKAELSEIVGAEYVFDDIQTLGKYSEDYSLKKPALPNYVAQPGTTVEVQKIVKVANEHKVPLIPSSSQVHFYGATIPSQGGVILDLRRMNRILEIDDRNRKAKLEPGVTWEQIQAELRKRGRMMISPLLPHSLCSPLTSYLEREAPLIPIYEYGDPIEGMEVVWPTGDIFRTGSASAPNYPDTFVEGANPLGPGLDFYMLLHCAQGTMGVVSWANIKFEYLPKVNKTFFVPLHGVGDAVELIYRIQRRKIGHECFVLNKLNLATILAEEWPEDFTALMETLPPWMLLLILSGAYRYPEEKVAYQEKALRQIKGSEFSGIALLPSLPGVPGVERRLPDMLRQPWPKEKTYWKHLYKGSCQDLIFVAILDQAPQFVTLVSEVAARHGHPMTDVGCYVQPIEYARACHIEFNFYYSADNAGEVERVQRIYSEAAEALQNRGALFTRPYGVLADLVYSRAAEYTAALKKVKSVFDPNNIMCPGNLCF